MPNPTDRRWIVLKFGGTSVSRRERWDTIGELASARVAQGYRALVVDSGWTTEAFTDWVAAALTRR